MPSARITRRVSISAETVQRDGELEIPPHSQGLVIFAHSNKDNGERACNRRVADLLHAAGFATLDCDLLTGDEENSDIVHKHLLHFDLHLLVSRLRQVTNWAVKNDKTAALRIGYFGINTGAAAALIAHVEDRADIGAIVSLAGRAG